MCISIRLHLSTLCVTHAYKHTFNINTNYQHTHTHTPTPAGGYLSIYTVNVP